MSENNTVQDLISRMNGNSDQLTKRYFEKFAIEMRIIDSDLASTTMTLFGQEFDTPVTLGVIGGFERMGENALLNSALAAKELNTILWVSSHISPDQLSELTATGAKVIQVVKPYLDEELWLKELKQAEERGCFAAATDIDHAYNKSGDYDGQANKFGPKSLAQMKKAAESLNIPFIAKGVLSLQDASKCKEAGVAGIILSHHHNIMSSAVPPMMILPEIRAALGKDYPVLVDCGINSGCEAFKALAFGASGLAIARPYMAPLASEGKEGVVNFVRRMTGEMREFMNRTGSPDIKHIDPSVLRELPF